MKGNINIDELFKQKFDNFQPEVDPSVWANVQAGIGAGTANQLLKTFRSVTGVRQQSLEDLSKIIGVSKAKIVKAYFEAED